MPFKPLGDGLAQTIERVDFWRDNPGQLSGLPTGLQPWDDATGGIEATDLVVLGGRPGMGKTALALNIAARVARMCNDKERVLLVSTEMPADLIRRRLASMRCKVSDHKLRLGAGTPEQYAAFRAALEAVSTLRLLICDAPGVWADKPERPHDPDTVAGGARLLIQQGLDPRLIVVDHVSRLGDDPTLSPNYRVGGIARKLKNLAMEIQSPVILLSQLNRQVEQRDDKRPSLSDLRDSGEVEQEADLVALMYRQDYYLERGQVGYDNRLAGKCQIEIAKARSGPVGKFDLSFDPDTQLFS